MKIGILQTGYIPDDLTEKHEQYPEMFKTLLDGHGFEWETYDILKNKFPENAKACDGWLITGSRHGAYEDHAWIPPLEEFIRSVYAQNVPIVGICFGHQIMAQALGGKVENFGGIWGVGRTEYETDEGTISIMAMHQDQVVKKPEEAEVIASTDFCKFAGLAYKNRAMSIQPHPEFSTEFTRDLIELRKGQAISTDQAEAALSDIEGHLDTQKLSDQIADFFKTA